MKFLWVTTYIGWDLYLVTFNGHQAHAPDMTTGGYVCRLYGIEYSFCEEWSTSIDIYILIYPICPCAIDLSHPPRPCSLRRGREVLWPLSFLPVVSSRSLHGSAGRVNALSASYWYHISIFIRYKLTLTHNGIVKCRLFVCERGEPISNMLEIIQAPNSTTTFTNVVYGICLRAFDI